MKNDVRTAHGVAEIKMGASEGGSYRQVVAIVTSPTTTHNAIARNVHLELAISDQFFFCNSWGKRTEFLLYF